MPCNCSGVRMKRCSCKVFGYPLAKSRTQNVVLVEEGTTRVGASDDNCEKLNLFLRLFEHLYDKCAEYNLRYCPLRGKHKRGKPLTNAAKDIVILVWFLVANFIVFLNISTRITIHMFLLLLEIVKWLERLAHAAINRHSLKSKCDTTTVLNSGFHPDH